MAHRTLWVAGQVNVTLCALQMPPFSESQESLLHPLLGAALDFSRNECPPEVHSPQAAKDADLHSLGPALLPELWWQQKKSGETAFV